MTDKSAIVSEYGLELVKEFNHLKMVQVRPSNIGDAILLIETLEDDGRIKAAELNTNFGRLREL